MKLTLATLAMSALTVLSAHSASASDDSPPIPPDVALAADEGQVDARDVLGAMATLKDAGVPVDARTYLIGEGVLQPAVPVPAGRLACIAWHESHNDPNATNRYSGAGGLYQFLQSTWMTTPQGRAGLSRYDPVAATAAAQWMVDQGRIREWSVIQMGLC